MKALHIEFLSDLDTNEAIRKHETKLKNVAKALDVLQNSITTQQKEQA